eukprot:358229-Chlamydomonas_euryale.AAC.6
MTWSGASGLRPSFKRKGGRARVYESAVLACAHTHLQAPTPYEKVHAWRDDGAPESKEEEPAAPGVGREYPRPHFLKPAHEGPVVLLLAFDVAVVAARAAAAGDAAGTLQH